MFPLSGNISKRKWTRGSSSRWHLWSYGITFSVTGPQPLSSLRRAGNWASRPRHRALARSSLSILKEISPEISLEGMMLKAETPVLWPPHAKSWLIGKDSDPGRDWGQEEKGTTEDEMAGWHHWLDGRESQWTPGDGDGQGGLACCNSWGGKESDTTEQLIWSDVILSRDLKIVSWSLPLTVAVSSLKIVFTF